MSGRALPQLRRSASEIEGPPRTLTEISESSSRTSARGYSATGGSATPVTRALSDRQIAAVHSYRAASCPAGLVGSKKQHRTEESPRLAEPAERDNRLGPRAADAATIALSKAGNSTLATDGRRTSTR